MRDNLRLPIYAVAVASASVLLAGCGAMVAGSTKANTAIAKAEQMTEEIQLTRLDPRKARPGLDERVRVETGVFIPTEENKDDGKQNTGSWLREIKGMALHSSDKGTPVSQLVAMLAAKGVNVSSDLPLHTYQYSGVINPTDAESFLKMVLGTVGLDFVADDAKRSLVIRPMKEKTWYFNVTKQGTSIGGGEVGGGTQGIASSLNGQQGGYGMNQGYGGMPGMSGAQGMQQPIQQPRVATSSPSSASSGGAFWTSLEKEIKDRLNVLVPSQSSSSSGAAGAGAPNMAGGVMPPPPNGAQPIPTGSLPPPLQNIALSTGMQPMGMPPGMQGAGPQMAAGALPIAGPGAMGGSRGPETGVTGYQTKSMGTYSINPDTGAVTVQAPSWILSSLDTYFAKVRDAQNVEISFEGLLILVANDGRTSEGFDIQGFQKWLGGKYQFLASNSPLGGVTLSFPGAGAGAGDVPRAIANAASLNGPLIGINKPDGLRLFNDYLEERGRYKVLQQPLISTTSDTPASFERTTTRYFNTVTQQVGQSQTNTQLATQNVINSVELGTILRVHPKLEEVNGSGLVRAKLFLSQVTASGDQNIPQTITVGTTSQTIVVTIPVLARMKYEGETLMRDGDLLIVGGQKEESASVTENGLPGSDGPTLLGGFTGSRGSSNTKQTTYFALQVRVNKKK